MIDLDDAAALRGADPSDMLGAVAALPGQSGDAYRTGLEASGLPELDGITSVVFCGMGGSAVAGDVLKQTFRSRLPVPVDVNRSPALPAFAGPHSLVIVSSYSGGTAETLAAFREAVARGTRIIAVTSGGELGEACAEHGIASVAVPTGLQPRAALGLLTFSMLGALEAAGLLPPLVDDVEETVEVVARRAGSLDPQVPTGSNEAKGLAGWIGDRVPVVWGAEGIGSLAATRWKTQVNENGKMPAVNSSMSELDHNEVVGWTAPFGERFVVIGLRHDGEDAETGARFDLTAEVVRDAGGEYREAHAIGRSSLATLFSMIVLGDYVSCYVGLRRGVDPTPVEAIGRLKDALARR